VILKNDPIWIVLMLAMLGFMTYYRVKKDMYGLVWTGFVFISCIIMKVG